MSTVNAIRPLRVGELIRRELAVLFQKRDFRNLILRNVEITIVQVVMSADLSNARIYFYPFYQELKHNMLEDIGRALVQVSPYLRRVLSSRLFLRTIPHLQFCLDDSFPKSELVERALLSLSVCQDVSRNR